MVVGSCSYYFSKRKMIAGIFLFLACLYATSITSSSIEYIALIATTSTCRTITPLIFVYTMEIIPTTHRATAKGCAVAASILSKYIPLIYFPIIMTRETHTNLRSLCACLCITCALVLNFGSAPPEDLPDVMEDIECKNEVRHRLV